MEKPSEDFSPSPNESCSLHFQIVWNVWDYFAHRSSGDALEVFGVSAVPPPEKGGFLFVETVKEKATKSENLQLKYPVLNQIFTNLSAKEERTHGWKKKNPPPPKYIECWWFPIKFEGKPNEFHFFPFFQKSFMSSNYCKLDSFFGKTILAK